MTKDELCTLVNQDPTGIGTFLTRAQAKTRLNDYQQRIPNPSKDVIAHVFGLDMLKELMDRINAYNDGALGEDNDIAGIRIYHCHISDRDYYDKNDLFLIPVTKDGRDIYPLKNNVSVSGGDIILGDPRPCPNMCSPSYQL